MKTHEYGVAIAMSERMMPAEPHAMRQADDAIRMRVAGEGRVLIPGSQRIEDEPARAGQPCIAYDQGCPLADEDHRHRIVLWEARDTILRSISLSDCTPTKFDCTSDHEHIEGCAGYRYGCGLSLSIELVEEHWKVPAKDRRGRFQPTRLLREAHADGHTVSWPGEWPMWALLLTVDDDGRLTKVSW